MPTSGAATTETEYLQSLARGFGGALLFALPLLMTSEMWWLGGFIMDPARLLLFLVVSLPMLLGLSYHVGFEPTFRLKDEILDALAALAIGFLLAAVVLSVFGELNLDNTLAELVGKVAICAIPGAIGALLAGKQFKARGIDHQERGPPSYGGTLFLMAVGAVFLAFNVAPTEEVVVVNQMMSPVQALLLMAASILILHAFAYALGFQGEDRRREAGGFARTLLFFTLPGYGLAVMISFYCLWTFGRLDGLPWQEQIAMTVVLTFPASLGAATARLVT